MMILVLCKTSSFNAIACISLACILFLQGHYLIIVFDFLQNKRLHERIIKHKLILITKCRINEKNKTYRYCSNKYILNCMHMKY